MDILPSPDTASINKEHLELLTTLSEEDPKAFIVDLLKSFQQSWNTLSVAIKQSCETKDNATLRKSVHQLCGSSANLGLERLCSLCRNVESQISENKFTSYAECYPLIEKEFNSSMSVIQEFVNKL